jgi:hypothetical protein
MKKILFALVLLVTPLQTFAATDDGYHSTDPEIVKRIAWMMEEVARLTTPGAGYVSDDPSVRAQVLAMTSGIATEPRVIIIVMPPVPAPQEMAPLTTEVPPAPFDLASAEQTIRARFMQSVTDYPWKNDNGDVKSMVKYDLAIKAADEYLSELKLDKKSTTYTDSKRILREIGAKVFDESNN